MLHFCTYFDINYIHRGLALYRSLEAKSSSFMLWTLCFDDRTYEVLRSLNLPHMRLIQRNEFEENDEELIACKSDRTRTEYYWTCSPSFPLFLFRKYPEIELLCYVDADYFFFSNPQIIFDTVGKGSIFIIPHDYDERRFGKNFRSGKYNVGVIIFRKDRVGLQCLELWRNQCIEWCYLKAEDGKWGDQGYLEDWPERYENLVISSNPGIHAAPWNIAKFVLQQNSGGGLSIENETLTCFHFHALKMINKNTALVPEGYTFMNRFIRNYIYIPYIHALMEAISQVENAGHQIPYKLDRSDVLLLAYNLLRGRWSLNVIRV